MALIRPKRLLALRECKKMAQRRTTLTISLLVILLALVAGGTSAYFTFSSRAHNIITTSGIAIELIEDTDRTGVDGRAIPFTNIEGALPGDVISKIPKVKNVDDGAVYVRISAQASAKIASGEQRAVDLELFELDINTTAWTLKDGFYYYKQKLNAGEITEPLFTTVTLSRKINDAFQDATFALEINASAVQAANNGTDVFTAQGWPEEQE